MKRPKNWPNGSLSRQERQIMDIVYEDDLGGGERGFGAAQTRERSLDDDELDRIEKLIEDYRNRTPKKKKKMNFTKIRSELLSVFAKGGATRIARILDDSQPRERPRPRTRRPFMVLVGVCILGVGSSYVGSADAREVEQGNPKRNPAKKNGIATKQQRATEKKLTNTIIPGVDFEGVDLKTAIRFLRGVTKNNKAGPLKFQVADEELGGRKVHALKLQDVPLSLVLRFVNQQTQTSYSVNARGVIVITDAKGKKPAPVPAKPAPGPGAKAINDKLRGIILPSVSFDGRTVGEAIDFLRLRSAQLDTIELDRQKKGINVIIRKSKNREQGADIARVKLGILDRRNIALGDLLKQIAAEAGATMEVEEYAVVLTPRE